MAFCLFKVLAMAFSRGEFSGGSQLIKSLTWEFCKNTPVVSGGAVSWIVRHAGCGGSPG